jgi:transposase-like protein
MDKKRGVEDILIACVDDLNGFSQAIEAVCPKTEIQQCIIHQIRNPTKFVSYKDIKKTADPVTFIADLYDVKDFLFHGMSLLKLRYTLL